MSVHCHCQFLLLDENTNKTHTTPAHITNHPIRMSDSNEPMRMSDSPLSFYNFKNNPVNSQPCNYKIISINKDQNTNQHSSRIGISDEKKLGRRGSDNSNNNNNNSNNSTGSCECQHGRPVSPSGRLTYQM